LEFGDLDVVLRSKLETLRQLSLLECRNPACILFARLLALFRQQLYFFFKDVFGHFGEEHFGLH
jgi:hypothetical protein